MGTAAEGGGTAEGAALGAAREARGASGLRPRLGVRVEEAERRGGDLRASGPETHPEASVQIKAFRSKRARPGPGCAPQRSAQNGGPGGRGRVK